MTLFYHINLLKSMNKNKTPHEAEMLIFLCYDFFPEAEEDRQTCQVWEEEALLNGISVYFCSEVGCFYSLPFEKLLKINKAYAS